ncbi:hypothetical protein [Blastomonas sp. AAP53]|uniref:hypothetical protein n=1 Tax=Blastomonas sp. AAP53 TaxID=1248760 RepID=UPI000370735D|nr:hypothetical protein [Blastomonas sp. AAP53]
MVSAGQETAGLWVNVRVQQGGLKLCMLTLLIALTRARRMKRAQVGDVKIFKQLIEIGQKVALIAEQARAWSGMPQVSQSRVGLK